MSFLHHAAAGCAAFLLIVSAGRAATASPDWTPPALLNTYGSADPYPDLSPAVAADGAGNWVAVWEFVDPGDREIFCARSADNGESWSYATVVNATASADGGAFDITPTVATDGRGKWIAAWSSRWNPVAGTLSADYDVLCSISVDNGLTWSAPLPVRADHASDTADDLLPHLAADGGGNWVVTWTARHSGGSQTLEAVRSSDGGGSWQSVPSISSFLLSTGSTLLSARQAADRSGTWMVVATCDAHLPGGSGSGGFGVLAWRSPDGGASWSGPTILDSNAENDSASGPAPDVATDGRGGWIAVWHSISLPGSIDGGIAVARSVDGGLSWSAPVLAASGAPAGGLIDERPRVAGDLFGSWIIAWDTDAWEGTDVAAVHSSNRGLTWSAMGPLDPAAPFVRGTNRLGTLATDGSGWWLAAWASTDIPTATESEPDILFSRSRFVSSPAILQEDFYSENEVPGDGYGMIGQNIAGFAWTEYSPSAGAWLAHVAAEGTAAPRLRVTGAYAREGAWLPYSNIGPSRYVRVKYSIYAGGQADPSRLNTIPNLRIRAGVRFGQTSILDVYNHQNVDPAGDPYGAELRPSSDPARPSVYRVDLDPVDIPFLQQNAATEGVLRAFEAYSGDPQDNGYLAMTESSIGVYPALWPHVGNPMKIYAPSATGAGTLAGWDPQVDRVRAVYHLPSGPGTMPARDESLDHTVVITEGPFGVTLDTTAVPADRIGVACRDFHPGPTTTASDYVRVEPEKQYLVRFHLTSTQSVSANAYIRCRARSVRWNWTQRFEFGGAWGTGASATSGNNAVAQQTVPGVGCLNPDQRTPGEPGGWYTLLMHTPLSPDIRPEVEGSLSARMPLLASSPGPRDPEPSVRDLKVALDLIDTLSPGPYAWREQGNVTVDRIYIYSHPLVAD